MFSCFINLSFVSLQKNSLEMKRILLVGLMVLFSIDFFYGQCAMCKAVAESDLKNNPNSVTKGINNGIIYLMLIPYILIGFFFRKEIVRFIKGLSNKQN